jgi:hypothetical protein
MADQAYIGLTDDGYWALFYGDGTEYERYALTVGQPFEPGAAIQDAVAELARLALENGYDVIVPHYGLHDIPLLDVIEPEFYDEAFGDYDENSEL